MKKNNGHVLTKNSKKFIGLFKAFQLEVKKELESLGVETDPERFEILSFTVYTKSHCVVFCVGNSCYTVCG